MRTIFIWALVASGLAALIIGALLISHGLAVMVVGALLLQTARMVIADESS